MRIKLILRHSMLRQKYEFYYQFKNFGRAYNFILSAHYFFYFLVLYNNKLLYRYLEFANISNQYFDTNDFRNITKLNFDQFLLLCDSRLLPLKKWHQIATQFYENKMIDKFLETVNFIKTT